SHDIFVLPNTDVFVRGTATAEGDEAQTDQASSYPEHGIQSATDGTNRPTRAEMQKTPGLPIEGDPGVFCSPRGGTWITDASSLCTFGTRRRNPAPHARAHAPQ